MKVIIYSSILLCCYICNSQIYDKPRPSFNIESTGYNKHLIINYLKKENSNSYNVKSYRDYSVGLNGSYYLFDKWENKSVIFTDTGREYVIMNINYDLEEGAFVSKISIDSVYMYRKISKVIINKKNEFDKIKDVFYQVLVRDKKLSLLKKNYGKMVSPKINLMTQEVIKKGVYRKQKEYYLLENDSTLVKVKLNKSLLNTLDSKYKKQIKTFYKANDLSFRREKDVIKIINYYNSL